MKKMMESNKRVAFLLAVALLIAALWGCSAKTASTASEESAAAYGYADDSADFAVSAVSNARVKSAASSGSTDGSVSGSAEDGSYARKIIYTATLTVRADDPSAVLEKASARCAELGGYLADSYERTWSDGTVEVTATLKVPAEQLDALLGDIGGLGKTESSRLSSDDISQSYYDVAARLKAAKTEEAALLKMYDSCTSVEEMLLVREQLASVRSDIESYQATVDLWDHQVAYATVDLTVKETTKTAAETEDETVELWKASDIFKKMRTGFSNSWRTVVNAIGAIGIFLANAFVPLAVLGAALYIVIRVVAALVRRGRARREAKKARRLSKKEEQKKE